MRTSDTPVGNVAPHADALADAAGRAHVQRLQPALPGWLLMYSPYGRRLVAFYLRDCPPGGIVVEAAHPDELLTETNLREFELRCQADAFAAPIPAQPATNSGGWL